MTQLIETLRRDYINKALKWQRYGYILSQKQKSGKKLTREEKSTLDDLRYDTESAIRKWSNAFTRAIGGYY